MRSMAIGLLVLAAGCDFAVEPGVERRLGVITGYQEGDPRIESPDTVWRGTSFSVTVVAYGGGCERKGETELVVSGNTATLTPYEYTDRSTGGCTRELKMFTHEADVRFDVPGTAKLVIRGRHRSSGDVMVTVERTVVVH